MDGTDVMGLFSIVLTLSIPLLAIALGIGKKIKKDKLDTELRMELIRNGASAELAQQLLKNPEKRAADNKITALRWGCALAGLGIAAIVCHLVGIDYDDFYMWMYLVLGCGVGLIISFVVEMVLGKKNEKLPDIKP